MVQPVRPWGLVRPAQAVGAAAAAAAAAPQTPSLLAVLTVPLWTRRLAFAGSDGPFGSLSGWCGVIWRSGAQGSVHSALVSVLGRMFLGRSRVPSSENASSDELNLRALQRKLQTAHSLCFLQSSATFEASRPQCSCTS